MLPQLAIANKLAALAGASLIGTATAAAAISGNLPLTNEEPTEIVEVAVAETSAPDEVEEPVAEEPAVEESAVEEPAVEEQAEVEPPADADGVAYGIDCDSATNHGEYVSSVAQDERLNGDDAEKKGPVVSAAAKTTCGKDDKEAKADDESDHDDDDESDHDDDESDHDDDDESDHDDDDDESDDDEKADQGPGKSEGKNKGKNKGKNADD